MNLLSLIQRVSISIGLPKPTVVIGNTDRSVVELLEAADQAGQHLTSDFIWQRMVIEHVFQTVAGSSKVGNVVGDGLTIQGLTAVPTLFVGYLVAGDGVEPWTEVLTVPNGNSVTVNLPITLANGVTFQFTQQDYDLPSDFDRMLHDTNWDRTNFWPNVGPKNAESWAWLKGGVITTGPRLRYRIYNNKFRISTPPDTVTTLSYEYVTENWVLATGGARPSKQTFTVDTDENIFKDNIMILATKLFWMESKGLETAKVAALLEVLLSKRKAQDQPMSTLSLSNVPANFLLTGNNIPETGYGA